MKCKSCPANASISGTADSMTRFPSQDFMAGACIATQTRDPAGRRRA